MVGFQELERGVQRVVPVCRGLTLLQRNLHGMPDSMLTFQQEEWVPMTDLNEETRQRRALIERWASADQAFRDVRSPLN